MSTKRTIAALFPGQGSQYVGMPKALMESFPESKQVFEEAADALKMNLLKLCMEGPESDLQLTMNQQPAILTTSWAWFSVLKKHLDFKPAFGAGHSLGEYSALLAAECMSLSEAVTLVRKRGELMQTAVKPGVGKMAAVIGLDDDKTKKACEIATDKTTLVACANFNSPGQVVIAGHKEAVERAEEILKGKTHPELKARRVLPLNVSAPFHCPLMTPVAESFLPFLKATHWKKREFPVVANVDAKLKKEEDLIPLLKDQIDHPVLWTQCAETLKASGATHYVEMGPGKVLTGLVKRILEKPVIFSMDSLEDFKQFERERT